ncbi:hypothetical protein GCM10027168_26340 [Streptomyces capparidis]
MPHMSARLLTTAAAKLAAGAALTAASPARVRSRSRHQGEYGCVQTPAAEATYRRST